MTKEQFITAALNDGYEVTEWRLTGMIEFERYDDRGYRRGMLSKNGAGERVLTIWLNVISGRVSEVIKSYAVAGRILRIEGAGFYGRDDWSTYSERKEE